MTPRVVFDCVVFLQAAARTAGPAAACLQLARDRRVELHASPDILTEVRDVLTRPKTQRQFPALTAAAVGIFLNDLAKVVVLRSVVPKAFTFPRDPKDEPYVDLAVAVGAEYLVSRDRDLLDLVADTATDRTFRERFPHLSIVDPPTFLQLVRDRERSAEPRSSHPDGGNESKEPTA